MPSEPSSTSQPASQSIVIVSGLPRSGTSMMMQMLQSGGLEVLTDKIREADDDNPRGYLEFEPVKRTKHDPSWLEAAAGKAVKMVHVLLRDLPTDRAYRVIFMRRNLDEALASQATMLKRLGQEGAALPPAKLAAIFDRQLREVHTYMGEQTCFKVLEIWYDRVIGDPLAQAEVVNEFLDGQLDPQAMAAVVEPALYRQKH